MDENTEITTKIRNELQSQSNNLRKEFNEVLKTIVENILISQSNSEFD